MNTIKKLLSVATLLVGVVSAAHAAKVPGPLVSTDWLQNNLQDVVILDVRKSHEGVKFVPGSVQVPWKQVRTNNQVDKDGETHDKLLPSKQAFETLMQERGVNNNSAVVIVTPGTGAGDVTWGTRLYWTLKYYGHDNMALLDGGAAKWTKEKRPLVPNARNPGKGNFTASAERRELLATSKDVAEALARGDTQLIDGRDEAQYLGLGRRPYVSAKGHIKGAINLQPYMLVLNPKNGAKSAPFHDAKTLKAVAQAKGISIDKPTITYCDSGHLSSGHWFVMSEILGNKNAAVYDGSMHAWTKDPARNKNVVSLTEN
ncbi:sulfurtransferase [Thiohalophilus sp.]|uniref:sulfurtransferase n=1 Tax=Thiohalophilus sp. TaxID=3028392 RepID=UPI002ACEC889|nr:rhodanese-like domain-containing protein [Thiohalophilus sp.]MDZ7663309.1 rhodanese-like domain-containing protein [Thiohalophilus sp.]